MEEQEEVEESKAQEETVQYPSDADGPSAHLLLLLAVAHCHFRFRHKSCYALGLIR